MFKRLSILLTLLFLSVIFVVGCSGNKEEANEGNSVSNDDSNEVEKEEPKKPVSISIATSGSGSSSYLTGGVISSVLNKEQSTMELSAIVTAGYEENAILTNSGSADIAMLVESSLDDAYYGEGDYPEAHDNIRKLFSFNLFYGHAIVSKKSGIESIEDIKGKKINLGVPAQITRSFNDSLMEGLGIDSDKDISMHQLSTGDAFDALQDGIIDGTFNMPGLGAGSLVELATTIDIKLLDFTDDIFDAYNEATGNLLQRSVIPANTYPGQDEEIPTWTAGVVFIANKDVDEEVIYEFTKSFWENLDKLKEEDPSFIGIEIEEHGLTASETPIHPGTERYFKEVGLIK